MVRRRRSIKGSCDRMMEVLDGPLLLRHEWAVGSLFGHAATSVNFIIRRVSVCSIRDVAMMARNGFGWKDL